MTTLLPRDWLGIVPHTDETLVGTPDGAIKTASVKILESDAQWSLEDVRAVVGYPIKMI